MKIEPRTSIWEIKVGPKYYSSYKCLPVYPKLDFCGAAQNISM